jgi:alanyl-tRNA synthetase
MTQKLYLDDPYLQNVTSTVIENTAVSGKPGIILNQTVFYPTSGGQPHDTGTINNIAVVDVFEDESQRIVHLLESPVNDFQVNGKINWQRRFDHMQQHTGQHILSQAFMKTCNADTISFHLGEKSSTVDLNQAGFSSETMTSVENLANQIIYENRKVIGHGVSENDLKQFPVRKLPTVEKNIRIIEIKDFDYSPCGGTHCSRTGEIGILKIRRFEHYKGGTRIHFVCGLRALKDYQQKTEVFKQLSKSMSSSQTDLYKNIQKSQEDLKLLRREHDLLKKQLLDYEAQALFAEHEVIGEICIIKKIYEDRNPKELKILAKKILDTFPKIVILFGTKAEGKAAMLFSRSEELSFNMGQLMETACAVVNGRGGGRPQHAQGGGPEVENLGNALQCAKDTLVGKH